jgi:hypothetical protein
MVIIKEMISVEYRLDYESLQLLERDCLRLDDNKLSLIRNESCFRNNLKKLISHMKSIYEDEILNKFWEDNGNHEGVHVECCDVAVTQINYPSLNK